MKRDVSHLYAQLGLGADCSLDELKAAYRRRVGQLHPDRPDSEHSPQAQAQLRELIRLYNTAARFHRRHGRLPGTVTLPSRRPVRAPPPTASRAAAPRAQQPFSPTRLQRLATVALVLVLLGMFAWSAFAPEPEDVAEQPASNLPTALASGSIALGVDEATVAAIQGRPTLVDGARWYYGPSWIEFDDGRVSDWNSSTLRPLVTDSVTPSR